MEARALIRGISMSPRKMRVVANLVRGKQVEAAVGMLDLMPKKAALIISKAVKSAAANAEEKSGGDVSVEEVLRHPTWKMGPKVTVDSATLLNKGLEVLEAHWLFGFGYDAIKVAVHPQSIVHALVRLRDGSLVAHLAPADMRLAIMGALHHPAIPAFPAITRIQT